MNPPKLQDLDYIKLLLSSPSRVTNTEGSRVMAEIGKDVSHDAFRRLLQRQVLDTEILWHEARQFIEIDQGVLVVDDTTLDKPYAKENELANYHWSGKHKQVVFGINMITMLWTNGQSIVPCDLRFYDKQTNGNTKNDSFREMLMSAYRRGILPKFVLFDSWYSSLDNLKFIRSLNWNWLTRLKKNRMVNPNGTGAISLSELDIPKDGITVYLRGYGNVRVMVEPRANGEQIYWATNDLEMTVSKRKNLEQLGWEIEVYHRGLKQYCHPEHCQARKANMQMAHILFSLRSFLRLEFAKRKWSMSWEQLKFSIIRPAVAAFFVTPSFQVDFSTA